MKSLIYKNILNFIIINDLKHGVFDFILKLFRWTPEFFINEIAKSEDPVAKKAIANLKNGNIAGYVKTFQDAGQMTTKEGNKLLRDIQAILRGYQVLGEQYKQEQ